MTPMTLPPLPRCPDCNCQMTRGNWSPDPSLEQCESCYYMGRQPMPRPVEGERPHSRGSQLSPLNSQLIRAR